MKGARRLEKAIKEREIDYMAPPLQNDPVLQKNWTCKEVSSNRTIQTSKEGPV